MTLTVHDGDRRAARARPASTRRPTFGAGAEHSTESAEGVAWEIHDDVLARTTSARTVSVSEYDTPYDGTAREDYRGEVSVDRRTFAQHAHADTTYDLTWPGIEIKVRSVMELDIVDGRVDVAIDTWAWRDGQEVSHRTWRETELLTCDVEVEANRSLVDGDDHWWAVDR